MAENGDELRSQDAIVKNAGQHQEYRAFWAERVNTDGAKSFRSTVGKNVRLEKRGKVINYGRA